MSREQRKEVYNTESATCKGVDGGVGASSLSGMLGA